MKEKSVCHRGIGLVAACAMCLLLVCGSACRTRGPGSPYVAPPFDPSRQQWEESFKRLKTSEIQLPAKGQYYIGPGDVLSLSLIGRPEILGENQNDKKFSILITENPFITLPFVGAITAHGKTPQELQEAIRVAYSTVIKEPVPVLTVEKYYYNQVAVLGSVKNPGKFPLEAGDTVLDAVFRAGGLTFGGASGGLPPSRVLKVYREKVSQKEKTILTPNELLDRLKEREGEVVPRDEIVVPLDEFLLGGNLAYNIPLQANDIVFIPPAGAVSVHGQVTNPRVIFLGPSLRTVVQVLTECGGLKYKAASRIEVVRANPDGTTASYFMHSRNMLNRKIEDFTLQDNDQVFVYKNTWRTLVDGAMGLFRATATTGINATYNPVP